MTAQTIHIWGGFFQACRDGNVGTVAVLVYALTKNEAKDKAMAMSYDRFPLTEGWTRHMSDVTGQTVSLSLEIEPHVDG